MKRGYTLALSLGLSLAALASSVTRVALAEPAAGAEKAASKAADEKPAGEKPVDIDSLEHLLADRINEAVSSGRLSPQEAAEFKQQLELVGESEASYRATDGHLNSWENLKLAMDLDHIERMLEYRLRDRRIAYLDLAPQRADLHRRLADALAAGRITKEQADAVKHRLANVARLEALLEKSDRVDALAILSLWLELDRLALHLEHESQERAVSAIDIETKTQALEKEIASSESAGKLPAEAAKEMRDRLARVKSMEILFKQSGLTPEMKLLLAIELERLSDRIARRASGGDAAPVDTAALQKELDKRIAYQVLVGALTPQEAARLLRSLNEIETWRKNTEQAHKGLSEQDKQQMTLDLERLAETIDSRSHHPSVTWPGLDAFQARYDMRVADGLAAQRLTEEQAKSLQAEADRLNEQEKKDSLSDGGLTADEAINLCQEVQRVSAVLDRNLTDRKIDVPDVVVMAKDTDALLARAVNEGRLCVGDAKELKDKLELVGRQLDLLNGPQPAGGKRTTAGAGSTAIAGADLTPDRLKLFIGCELEIIGAAINRALKGMPEEIQSLREKRTQVFRDINEGLGQGRLTPKQSQDLLAEVRKLMRDEEDAKTSGGGMSADESIRLSEAYDKLDIQVHLQMADSAIPFYRLDDHRKQIEGAIFWALTGGKLSAEAADNLLTRLSHIRERAAKGRATAGGLSYGEKLKVAYEMDRVNNVLAQQLSSDSIILPSVGDQLNAAESRIAAALVAGHLNTAEAQKLKERLDTMAGLAQVMKSTGRGISYAEVLVLTDELRALANEIDEYIVSKSAQHADIDTLQAQLENQIKAAKSRGHVNDDEAGDLLEDLQRTADSEAAFRVSGEGLDYAEALTLYLDLERIGTRLAGLTKATVQPSDIEKRHLELTNRINKEIAGKKISAKDALALRKELERIQKLARTYKSAPGGMSPAQARQLNSDLDRFSQRIWQ